MNERPAHSKLRTKAFALRLPRSSSALPKANRVAQVRGLQVLRLGTSVGANYREASRGRSKAEFPAPTGDCLKGIESTGYRLELLVGSGGPAAAELAKLFDENRQLIAITHEHY